MASSSTGEREDYNSKMIRSRDIYENVVTNSKPLNKIKNESNSEKILQGSQGRLPESFLCFFRCVYWHF